MRPVDTRQPTTTSCMWVGRGLGNVRVTLIELIRETIEDNLRKGPLYRLLTALRQCVLPFKILSF